MTERFTCPVCGTASSDPEDLAEGYCGRCRYFTGEESLRRAMELVATAPCPTCGEKALQVVIQDYFVADPLGTYSVAGAQPKVTASKVKWPFVVCSRPECGFYEAAKVD